MRLLAVLLCLSVFGGSVQAADLAPSYQEVCRAGEHPKWVYGKEGTPTQLKPLFGCDERFGARRDADERFVEKLQESGVEGPGLSWQLVRQGWKWMGLRKVSVALNRFNLAFEADPANGDVYHGIAVVMSATAQPDNIIDYWFDLGVKQVKGQPGRFSDYGRFLVMTGRLDEARPILETALKQEPFNAWAMGNLAQVHLQQDRPAEACPYIAGIAGAKPPPGFPQAQFDQFQTHWQQQGEAAGC